MPAASLPELLSRQRPEELAGSGGLQDCSPGRSPGCRSIAQRTAGRLTANVHGSGYRWKHWGGGRQRSGSSSQQPTPVNIHGVDVVLRCAASDCSACRRQGRRLAGLAAPDRGRSQGHGAVRTCYWVRLHNSLPRYVAAPDARSAARLPGPAACERCSGRCGARLIGIEAAAREQPRE
eukprot:scaffold406_cov391-Prasinococcus_capsulatus_cf.AAC.14